MRGRTFADPAELDGALIDLDGTPTKSRLGANAIVGVSMAVVRALAVSSGRPLWLVLSPPGVAPRLPVPHFNVVNGGMHAPNALDFQEFMIAPLGAPNLTEAVRAGAEVYATLRGLLAGQGCHRPGRRRRVRSQDRPPRGRPRLLVEAIEAAGYVPGPQGVAIALDPAASEFFAAGTTGWRGRRCRATT